MNVKVAGSVDYPFVAHSLSSNTGLGYNTLEAAEKHCVDMSKSLERWPKGWNVEFWKTKPEPWVAKSTK